MSKTSPSRCNGDKYDSPGRYPRFCARCRSGTPARTGNTRPPPGWGCPDS